MKLTPEQIDALHDDYNRDADYPEFRDVHNLLDTIDALTAELASAREREKAELKVVSNVIIESLREEIHKMREAISPGRQNVGCDYYCAVARRLREKDTPIHLKDTDRTYTAEEMRLERAAVEAAAYRKAAESIGTTYVQYDGWARQSDVAAAILALISPSAQSALDAMIAEVRLKSEYVGMERQHSLTCDQCNFGTRDCRYLLAIRNEGYKLLAARRAACGTPEEKTSHAKTDN